ncbi:MAG: hypothetical protein WB588_03495 [Dehalococcoidia bacterium]
MDHTKIFLTDDEFEELFGPQISRIVKILNETAVAVCPPCDGYCCKNIHCGLYSDKFSTCPIYEIRPRECRYHFCNDVFTRAPLNKEEKDMMVQPVEELICGNRGDIARLFFLFPEFPLDDKGLAARGMKEAVDRIKNDFEEGRLDQPSAFSLLKGLCRG